MKRQVSWGLPTVAETNVDVATAAIKANKATNKTKMTQNGYTTQQPRSIT